MFKASLITMALFYVFVLWQGQIIAEYLFPWGGVAESYFKPIYLGIVVLSGLIVGCTCYIAELIKDSKAE